jgi:SMC interacting uncharacterized protein involved in chromosome segregation
MSEERKDWIHRELESLRTTRDELQVQVHLAAAEARDRWEDLERSWSHLESHVKQISQAASDAADGVEQAASLLIDEIKASYQHIRQVM